MGSMGPVSWAHVSANLDVVSRLRLSLLVWVSLLGLGEVS